MAQQFHGLSHYPVGLSIVSNNSSSYTASSSQLPGIPLQSNLPYIKEEIFSSTQSDQAVEDNLAGRPKKRSQLVEDGSSHKFVSQKKWKFSDAQPWLPSKLSSKAQNASKAVSKKKSELNNPKRSSSPEAASAAVTTGAPVGPPPQRRSGPLRPSELPSDALLRPIALDTQSLHSSVARKNSSRQRTTMHRSLPSSVSPGPLMSRNGFRPQPKQQQNAHDHEALSQAANSVSARTTQPVITRLRSSRSAKTLSLEKDAERIATLIAEKKRANESSLFRERMLKRQLKHKNQRELSRDMEEISETHSSHASVSPSYMLEGQHSFDQLSPSGVTNVPISPKPATSNRTSINQAQSLPQGHLQRSSMEGQGPGGHSAADKCTRSSEPVFPGTSPSSLSSGPVLATQQLCHDEHEILFGRHTTSKLFTSSSQLPSQGRVHIATPPPLPAKGSAPFEVEDADLTAQLVAFTNQLLLPGRTRDSHVRSRDDDQYTHLHHYERQVPSPLSAMRSQTTRHTSSAVTTNHQRSVEALAKPTPLPANLSIPQSPTSISTRHFSHLEASGHPYRPMTMYAHASNHSRPASTEQTSATQAEYCNTNRQIWTHPQQHVDPYSLAKPTTSSLPPTLNVVGETPAASTTMTQRLTQPPVLTSNMNMFSGNARSNSGNGVGAAPPKPRVNMFSDTKGTPFPMHEVIRQIEMT